MRVIGCLAVPDVQQDNTCNGVRDQEKPECES